MTVCLRFAFASLLVFPSVAGGREVSFREAREEAARVAMPVRIAEAEADVSMANVTIADTLQNPTLSVSTAKETARLGISLGLPLPLFGQRATARRAALADADAATLNVGVARVDARRSATLAWIDLFTAEERTRLLALAAEEAERLFRIAKEKFDAGTGPRLDLVRTRAESAAAAAEVAKRLELSYSAKLAPWIGAAPDAELSTIGQPGYPIDSPKGLSTLVAQVTDHPTMRRDRAEVVAAGKHIENERRLRLPVLTPQVTVNQFDPGLPGTDVIAGLSFEIPVLGLRKGEIARARALETLASRASDADAQALRAAVSDAFRRLEGAEIRLHALREQVLPAMKEARDMTEEGYRSGRIDQIRMIETERAFLESRMAEVEAAADWHRAVADVEWSVGKDLSSGGLDAP